MAWLTEIDTRAQHWPSPFRWSYVCLKWSLIALGAWLALQMAITQRSGLGLGIMVAIALALIKGIMIAMKRQH